MPTATAVLFAVMCALMSLVLMYLPAGRKYFIAVCAAAGGSPCVQHLVGSSWVSVPSGLQSGSLASVHSVPLYGSTDSSTMPNWWIVWMLSRMFEPSAFGSDCSSVFTAHCKYCSEKLGFCWPALM